MLELKVGMRLRYIGISFTAGNGRKHMQGDILKIVSADGGRVNLDDYTSWPINSIWDYFEVVAETPTPAPTATDQFPTPRDELAIKIMMQRLGADGAMFRDPSVLANSCYRLVDAMMTARGERK